jgi:hypothetical protein
MSCSMEYCHGPAGSGENRARGHPGIQFNCDCYSTLLQDCRRIPPAHGDRKQFGRSRKLPAGRVDVVDRPRVTPAASLQPVRTDGALHLSSGLPLPPRASFRSPSPCCCARSPHAPLAWSSHRPLDRRAARHAPQGGRLLDRVRPAFDGRCGGYRSGTGGPIDGIERVVASGKGA